MKNILDKVNDFMSTDLIQNTSWFKNLSEAEKDKIHYGGVIDMNITVWLGMLICLFLLLLMVCIQFDWPTKIAWKLVIGSIILFAVWFIKKCCEEE